MMRLIDADSLKAEIAKRTPHFVQRIEFTPCFEAIRDAKTVDAVEVVRCGECKYHRRCMLQHFVESNAADGAKIDWNKWYCADGERKYDVS